MATCFTGVHTQGAQTKPTRQNLYSNLPKNTRKITKKPPIVKTINSNSHSSELTLSMGYRARKEQS